MFQLVTFCVFTLITAIIPGVGARFRLARLLSAIRVRSPSKSIHSSAFTRTTG